MSMHQADIPAVCAYMTAVLRIRHELQRMQVFMPAFSQSKSADANTQADEITTAQMQV